MYKVDGNTPANACSKTRLPYYFIILNYGYSSRDGRTPLRQRRNHFIFLTQKGTRSSSLTFKAVRTATCGSGREGEHQPSPGWKLFRILITQPTVTLNLNYTTRLAHACNVRFSVPNRLVKRVDSKSSETNINSMQNTPKEEFQVGSTVCTFCILATLILDHTNL